MQGECDIGNSVRGKTAVRATKLLCQGTALLLA